MYTYITDDNDPGTIVVHSDLSAPFEQQRLMDMDRCSKSTTTIRQLLTGFAKFGDADVMDLLNIEYPIDQSAATNKIIGRHMYLSSNEIAEEFGKDKNFVFEDNDVDSVCTSDLSDDNFQEQPVRKFEFVDFDVDVNAGVDADIENQASQCNVNVGKQECSDDEIDTGVTDLPTDVECDYCDDNHDDNHDDRHINPSDQLDDMIAQLDVINNTAVKDAERLLSAF